MKSLIKKLIEWSCPHLIEKEDKWIGMTLDNGHTFNIDHYFPQPMVMPKIPPAGIINPKDPPDLVTTETYYPAYKVYERKVVMYISRSQYMQMNFAEVII